MQMKISIPKFFLRLVFDLFLVTSLLCGFFTYSTMAQQFQVWNPPPVQAPRYVPGEIVVKFKPGIDPNAIDRLNQNQKVSVLETNNTLGFMRLKTPAGKSVEDMVAIYSRNPDVEYAEPNFIVTAHMVPNDPYYHPYQWHLDNSTYGGINMETAWDISTGSSSVIVAVLDTGVAYEDYDIYLQARDLAGTTFVPGYDFINDDNHPNDDHSHGTHVTGTIAQTTNNSYGVAGVAFQTAIMPVKVLSSSGGGTDTTVANGIQYAADNGAKVINMSLGGPSPSSVLEDAVEYAYSNGVTIVAATGNNGAEAVGYPAAYEECIAVGATRYDEAIAYYSNYGQEIDLVAPGGDVTVDQNGDGNPDGVLQETINPNTHDPKDFNFWFFQGTSMATPHVSGVAALVIAKYGDIGPDNVRQKLQTTAEDHGATGWDKYYGWGIVDAHKAISGDIPNYGDVTGDDSITALDAAVVLQACVGLITLTPEQEERADVSGENGVTAYDAALIMQYVVGWLTKFPVAGGLAASARTGRVYTLSVGKVCAKANERIVVPISVDDTNGILSGELSLTYDAAYLKLIDVQVRNRSFTSFKDMVFGKNLVSKYNVRDGVLEISFANAEELNDKGTLLFVEFEVRKTSTSTIPLMLSETYLNEGLNIRKVDGWLKFIPETTALLNNFPNPFNPDTWLPYQLNESASVVIRIYNVSGQLVRIFDIGYRQPGFYIDKTDAAYWDGRNESGERVASGVYFYRLEAGKFSAVRKMTIIK